MGRRNTLYSSKFLRAKAGVSKKFNHINEGQLNPGVGDDSLVHALLSSFSNFSSSFWGKAQKDYGQVARLTVLHGLVSNRLAVN